MSINFESHKLDRRSFLKGAGMVGAASLLAACGGKSDNGSSAASTSGAAAPNTTGATPLKEFISWESGNRELESWNVLYTQQASDANVITNLWDGLLSFDCYGKVVPAIASSWEHHDDSTVWTFHLRDDVETLQEQLDELLVNLVNLSTDILDIDHKLDSLAQRRTYLNTRTRVRMTTGVFSAGPRKLKKAKRK